MIRAGSILPGSCFFAHQQTAGKGQRGKSWTSEKGANIALSIAITPSFLQPFQQFQLSAAVALGTYRCLEMYSDLGLRIKWPNDLFFDDRKMGGILIENIISSNTSSDDTTGSIKTGAASPETQQEKSAWKWAVIGIGLNVNQTNFPKELEHAVSLGQVTGRVYNAVMLAKEICSAVGAAIAELNRDGPSAILEYYNKVLYKRGELVKFRRQNYLFEALVDSVTPTGELRVQRTMEEELALGDVEWVR
jgi:BirA family transcriptional regulator, biotin operon repressor / biotin---[acetyl-CoA-carboxylase] ligase